MELDIALLFRLVPVAPVPRWDKEKLAGLVLRSQGRARFLAGVHRELEGLVSGSNLPQPHLNMEEYWNQLAGAIRRAGQPFLQAPRKRLERPEDTAAALYCMLQARQTAVHSSVDPVAIRVFVVQVSPHKTYQHCKAFGEICQHFGLHVESWMYSHVVIVNDPGMRRALLFRHPGTRGTSLKRGHWLFVSLGGLLGPRNEFIIKWLLPILVFSNGLSSSLLLGTKEVVVLKWRTDNLLLFLGTSRGRRSGFSVVRVV